MSLHWWAGDRSIAITGARPGLPVGRPWPLAKIAPSGEISKVERRAVSERAAKSSDKEGEICIFGDDNSARAWRRENG